MDVKKDNNEEGSQTETDGATELFFFITIMQYSIQKISKAAMTD